MHHADADIHHGVELKFGIIGCHGFCMKLTKWIPVLLVAISAFAEEQSSRTISPDGRLIAFVKSTPDNIVATGSGDEEATEIWTSKPDGANARMWLRGRTADATEETLANFRALQFSPDGTKIYFLSSAAATSGAVHMLDLDSGTESYVCPGNSLEVIYEGEYKGYLMVAQHRYFMGGGSYDWLWLLRPNGEAVEPIAGEGGSADDAEQHFREIYTPNSIKDWK